MGHNEHKLILYTDYVILVYYKITQVSSSYYNKTEAINTTTFYMRRATTFEILQFHLVEKNHIFRDTNCANDGI